MTLLKAIDTRYAGHLFRSRLEARVGVFLDTLGCSWSYEPEGYELPFSGRYLCDFLVHDFPFSDEKRSIWIEVKGTDPTRAEVNAMRELCCATGRYGFFMVGSCHMVGFAETNRPLYGKQELFKSFIKEKAERDELSGTCFLGRELLTHRSVPHSTFSPLVEDKDFAAVNPAAREAFLTELERLSSVVPREVPSAPFIRASRAALSARFEHGNRGRG